MLYFRTLTADAEPSQVPIADRTAEALERALLTVDDGECVAILAAAMQDDLAFGEWSRREAAGGAAADESSAVARWWAAGLATKLQDRLEVANEPADSDIERRFPALLRKLHACERQLAAFDERLEREKLESLKELAYGAGHEVNNPLANIAARAQSLLADEPHPERQRKLTAIHRQAMRAHEMIADLMLFARPPEPEVAECDLAEIVRRVIGEFAEDARGRSIEITCQAPSPVAATVDKTQLAVAVAALVKNALEAIGEKGRVEVAVRTVEIADENLAEIVVADDGPGIAPEVRRHIFDPFFSGREAGRGLGFGLSKCWRIVTDHGGTVVVASPASGGAEFTISLPISSPTSPTA
jgi:signal transduction histidine kinase